MCAIQPSMPPDPIHSPGVKMNQKIDRKVFDYDFTGYEIVDGKN